MNLLRIGITLTLFLSIFMIVSCDYSEKDKDRLREMSGTELEQAIRKTTLTDLSDMDFSGLDLSGIDLSGKNLSYCEFAGSNLQNCNLTQANLSHSDLENADLKGVIAVSTDFSYVDLRTIENVNELLTPGMKLEGTQLGIKDFRGMDLHEIDFSKCDLSFSNFSGANLRKTKFIKAELVGAIFNEADLTESDFTKADLQNAVFKKAKLEHTIMEDSDF